MPTKTISTKCSNFNFKVQILNFRNASRKDLIETYEKDEQNFFREKGKSA